MKVKSFLALVIILASCNNISKPVITNQSKNSICYLVTNSLSNKELYIYSQPYYINYKKDTIDNVSMREIVGPDKETVIDLGYNWKENIKEGLSIFVLNLDSLNNISTKPLDSTLIKRVVLQHINLSYEELKKDHFVVTYTSK
jgi:hypothetical protein